MSVTTYIALGGLVLSILNFILRLRDRRVRLQLYGAATYIPGERKPSWFVVTATNTNEIPTTVQHLYVLPRRLYFVPRKNVESIFFYSHESRVTPNLPAKLDRGEAVEAQISLPRLRDLLQNPEAGYGECARVVIVAQTTTGKKYKRWTKIKISSKDVREEE